MNPPKKDHVEKVLQAHYQFPGDYCAVSALEFVSKIYEQIAPDKFPLQDDPKNQHKGFDEYTLQNLVSLKGAAKHYDIQSAVETIEKETNAGKCVSIALPTFLVFGQILIYTSYHILVFLLLDEQPTLIDPQTKQILGKGKEALTKVLKWNLEKDRFRKTIHMEILEANNNQT